jgi:hypothetical protein
MRVKPARHLMIGSGKGVDHGEGRAILGENKGVCHKKADEPSPPFNTCQTGKYVDAGAHMDRLLAAFVSVAPHPGAGAKRHQTEKA